ncbi:MAG: autoinducer binding domain-containing protein [Sulfitobacter sp.]
MSIVDLSKLPLPENDFRSFLDDVCAKHELDYAAYAGMDPFTQSVRGFVNYPDAWQSHYTSKGFERSDPSLMLASKSIAPVDWGRLRDEESFQTIFKDAHDFGISNQGVTIPVRGPYGDVGLFSVTRNCSDAEWKQLKQEILGDLQMAAVHLHDHVANISAVTRKLSHPSLSQREVEILQWVAAGKSQQDIGDILSISNRTVEVHLRSIRTKLAVLSTPQAVGRGIGLGLIYPI